MTTTVKLGFAPTRRAIFSAPAAVEYRKLTADRLRELGVTFADIDDINDEGLLYDDAGVEMIAEKFRRERVDGLFLAHVNFGTEYACARLAKKLNVPVLLWGPRDERPDEHGMRLRDSQCGLFATGKVLRRFGVPFTYMNNCHLQGPEFARGVRDFLAVCNVVRVFREARILQIGPRPYDFFSTMCNEGELLETFGIQLAPVPLPELYAEMNAWRREGREVEKVVAYCKEHMVCDIADEHLASVAALKVAMQSLARKYGCSAVAIQCWNALQDEIGIMPCAANSLLNEEGLPVVCETDVHGAISQLLAEAACMGERRVMFADWTVRHPDDENGELLQHCGPWPLSVAKEKPQICVPVAFPQNGAVSAEAKHGLMSLVRFDGDGGKYSVLLGHARGIDGPFTRGTYVWAKVQNLKRLEAKVVEGPYIHHVAAIHGDVVPVLYEACKYLGVQPDLYDPIEEKVRAYLRGEDVTFDEV